MLLRNALEEVQLACSIARYALQVDLWEATVHVEDLLDGRVVETLDECHICDAVLIPVVEDAPVTLVLGVVTDGGGVLESGIAASGGQSTIVSDLDRHIEAVRGPWTWQRSPSQLVPPQGVLDGDLVASILRGHQRRHLILHLQLGVAGLRGPLGRLLGVEVEVVCVGRSVTGEISEVLVVVVRAHYTLDLLLNLL